MGTILGVCPYVHVMGYYCYLAKINENGHQTGKTLLWPLLLTLSLVYDCIIYCSPPLNLSIESHITLI